MYSDGLASPWKPPLPAGPCCEAIQAAGRDTYKPGATGPHGLWPLELQAAAQLSSWVPAGTRDSMGAVDAAAESVRMSAAGLASRAPPDTTLKAAA